VKDKVYILRLFFFCQKHVLYPCTGGALEVLVINVITYEDCNNEWALEKLTQRRVIVNIKEKLLDKKYVDTTVTNVIRKLNTG